MKESARWIFHNKIFSNQTDFNNLQINTEMPKQELIIGRKDPSIPAAQAPDVPITGKNSDTVSRRHAKLSLTEKRGEYRLTDLGSANGTHYKTNNGWEQVDSTLVKRDTQVRLGKITATISELIYSYNKDNRPYLDRETGEIIDNSFDYQ